jgi:putative transposase
MKVIRVEQHVIKKSNPIYKTVDEYCFKSKNVYNYANYIIRQEFIKSGKWIRANDLDKMCQSSDCYKELGSQAAQKIIQLLDKNWKAFFCSIKDWSKNPNKYLGRPRLPKYKEKEGRMILILKNIQCSLKEGIFRISYKPFGGYSVKTHIQHEVKLIQCRFVPKGSNYVLEIVYETDVPNTQDYSERVASIDLGVSNFITMTNNMGAYPIVVKGGIIKSVNQYYNKQKASLQSELKILNNKHWSKRLQNITDKRNSRINYQMHCVSKLVVDWCVLYDINVLICGYNKEWKQESTLSKITNQNFIGIPYEIFVNQLRYKCENNGINFTITEENYTSGTSFLDNEEPIKANYNKSRRVYRGLFKSNEGKLINADVNGSYQIMKKVFPNAFSNGIGDVGLHPMTMKIA